MKISEAVWKFYRQHRGYSDEKMKKFREDPSPGLKAWVSMVELSIRKTPISAMGPMKLFLKLSVVTGE
jgi:hypothetical protein